MEVAAGQLLRVERDQDLGADRFLGEPVLFLLGAVAPDDFLRLGELGDLRHPTGEMNVAGGRLAANSFIGVAVRLLRIAPAKKLRLHVFVPSLSFRWSPRTSGVRS